MSEVNEVLAIATGRSKKRSHRFLEQNQQIALLELLVGKSGKGPRVPGAGLTGRWPELALIYAVPNGYYKSPGAAGRAKAEGLLKSVPDLCLPVARFPFHGLYLEGKFGNRPLRDDQREYIDALISEGYAAVEWRDVQQGLDIILRYLAMPRYHEVTQLEPGPLRFEALRHLQQPILSSHEVKELRDRRCACGRYAEGDVPNCECGTD